MAVEAKRLHLDHLFEVVFRKLAQVSLEVELCAGQVGAVCRFQFDAFGKDPDSRAGVPLHEKKAHTGL